MIDAGSKVKLLSIKEQQAYEMTIDEIFIKYADKVKRDNEKGLSTLNFGAMSEKIMLKDWHGWTDLFLIERHDPDPQIDWYDIESVHCNKVRVSGGHAINVYHPSDLSIGFHGEHKYRFVLEYAADLASKGDYSFYVREYGIDDDQPQPVQFFYAFSTKVESPGQIYGADIHVKSGHYTVNNIDMSASNIYGVSKSFYK